MNKKESFSFSLEELFQKNPKHCSREEDLLEYFEGHLKGNDKTEFESHLEDCVSCSQTLAELEEIQEAGIHTIVDSRKADKIFEEGRAKLSTAINQKYGLKQEAPYPVKSFDGFLQSFRMPAYANLLLIALLGALLYPSYKGMILNQEVTKLQSELEMERSKESTASESNTNLKEAYEKQIQQLTQERQTSLQPGISPSAIYSVRTERSSQEMIEANFGGKHKSLTLIFSLSPAEYKEYQVEILKDGNPVWEDSFQPTTSQDTSPLISVTLQEGFLPEGKYLLRVSGVANQKTISLAEFPLKVIL